MDDFPALVVSDIGEQMTNAQQEQERGLYLQANSSEALQNNMNLTSAFHCEVSNTYFKADQDWIVPETKVIYSIIYSQRTAQWDLNQGFRRWAA